MVDARHVRFKVDDRSYFAILKKDIHAVVVAAGFGSKRIAEIDIIVSELVTNLVKHAGSGQIWVKLIEDKNIQGLEIISVDDGPGMADVNKMLVDGTSTKKTLGQGLGAIKRLSDEFNIFSQKGWGSIILARIYDTERPAFCKPAPFEIKSVVLPKPGETACGDGFFYMKEEKVVKLFLGDGLGHGPDAEHAVEEAGKAFLQCHEEDPVAIIRHINLNVKKTRGLVGTVAVFDLAEKNWRVCGVGNILLKVVNPSAVKNYLSYNGIIGLNIPKTLNPQEIVYEKGQCLVMTSDGLKSRWDLLKLPAITRHDSTILCSALVKDFARYTDDISVAVCKLNL